MRRVEQPVAWRLANRRRDERAVHQHRERVEDLPLVDAARGRAAGHGIAGAFVVPFVQVVDFVAAHRLRRRQREGTDENAQAPEHGLLVGAELVVCPRQRGGQRVLARRGAAVTARQHAEALVQRGVELRRRQRRHTSRGHLDGERQAVEPARHADHRREIVRVEHEVAVAGTHARDEELHGGAGFGQGERGLRVGQ